MSGYEVDERIWDRVVNGSPALRTAICGEEPMYFAMYYFSQYFTYEIPPFHFDFYQDCKDLTNGVLDEAGWVAFRDSAKTSLAKIALACWCICYKKKRYINWDSYDKGNAESALFDITLALQTNRKLIADFGQLYYKKPARDALSEAKMKRISNFITENGVKVEAFSTQESTRGRIFGNIRPDLFIFDDFENNKTKDSLLVTKKIIDHIDELRAGLPAGASVLYLANFISEDGSVAYVMQNLKRNPRGRLRFVPVVLPTGSLAWPDKFVRTNNEATKANAPIGDPKQYKISLEAKREALGEAVYETELMNNPAKAGDYIFDRKKLEELKQKATKHEPLRIVAGLKLWAEYNAKHRYGQGADTSEGTGHDANALAVIDMSRRPALVTATYENNQIGPDVFAYELKRAGELFGACVTGVEINGTGYATLAQLRQIYDNIYRREIKNRVTGQAGYEYGWRTTSLTKPDIIYQLKSAVEDGDLEIWDTDLLEELWHYSKRHLRISGLTGMGMTRHFDKLMALAIAWEMRHVAKRQTIGKGYVEPPYRPSSTYEGGEQPKETPLFDFENQRPPPQLL